MYWVAMCATMLVLVTVDQLTKLAAVQYLASGNAVPLWNGVLELTYVENYGVAWGMMQNQRWVITVITSLMLLFVLGMLISRRFSNSRLATVGLLLILSGGIGNLIDRIVNGYVVDFVHYYKWFDFPVFNFADCCVSIGAVLILLYAFFPGASKESPKEEPADGTVPCKDDNGTDGQTP